MTSSTSLTVIQSTGVIGAEIGGVDLTKPLDTATVESITKALHDHLVLFFRDQSITDSQHRDFGANFGTLQRFPFAPAVSDEIPEVHRLDNDGGGKDRAPDKSADNWHSDATYMEFPPLGSILRAIRLPIVGGDTLWANMYAAYEGLSSRMQRMLDGMTAVNDAAKISQGNREAVHKRFPPREHPVVRTHPDTGRKLLFVNSLFTTRLVGLSERENAQVLSLLTDHVQQPEFQVRFRWEPNSIAFWDNRCTQHYAVPDYTEPRLMRRVVIEGTRP